MTKDEMLAGLREAAQYLDDASGFGSTEDRAFHAGLAENIRAAIMALEAAPAVVEITRLVDMTDGKWQAEAERWQARWQQEMDEHGKSLALAVEDRDRLRAELEQEQARGERAAIQRALYDATVQAKRAEQERDAALALVARVRELEEYAKSHEEDRQNWKWAEQQNLQLHDKLERLEAQVAAADRFIEAAARGESGVAVCELTAYRELRRQCDVGTLRAKDGGAHRFWSKGKEWRDE